MIKNKNVYTLEEDDILEKGDIIYYPYNETYTIKKGLVGSFVRSLSGWGTTIKKVERINRGNFIRRFLCKIGIHHNEEVAILSGWFGREPWCKYCGK